MITDLPHCREHHLVCRLGPHERHCHLVVLPVLLWARRAYQIVRLAYQLPLWVQVPRGRSLDRNHCLRKSFCQARNKEAVKMVGTE
jgi:hypothetical protein